MEKAENTHPNGKCYCTTVDLLIDWFEFDETIEAYYNSIDAKQLKPHKINRRSAIPLS